MTGVASYKNVNNEQDTFKFLAWSEWTETKSEFMRDKVQVYTTFCEDKQTELEL